MMNIESGVELERAVARVATAMGLIVETQVQMLDRMWGPRRHVDLVLSSPTSDRMLGIECKYQRVRGTAEERIPLTVEDIGEWPIDGLVVIHGDGFSRDFKAFLRARGRVIEYRQLAEYLRFYFRLPRDVGQQGELALNGSLEVQTD